MTIGSRLYDKLMRSHLRQQVSGATVIDITNVDEYCAGRKFDTIMAQVTCIRPPFPKMLLETSHRNNIGMWGLLIEAIGDQRFDAHLMEYSHKSSKSGCSVWWEFWLNEDGSFNRDIMYHDSLLELSPRIDQLKINMVGQMWVTMLAINFMHCKNVTLADNEQPLTPKQRKKLRGTPPVAYKTIVVRPFGARHEPSEDTEKAPTMPRDSRIVRGHFKTFTDEAPLFGKWAGMYWWSPVVKGDIERDYEIKAPSALSPDDLAAIKGSSE